MQKRSYWCRRPGHHWDRERGSISLYSKRRPDHLTEQKSVFERTSYSRGLLTSRCAFSLRCASGNGGVRGGGGVGDSEGQQSRKSNSCKLHGGYQGQRSCRINESRYCSVATVAVCNKPANAGK